MTMLPDPRGVPIRPGLWRAGEPLDHKKLNKPGQAIERQQKGVGSPERIKPELSRMILGQFRIKSIGEDVLVCAPFDGVNESPNTVLVAKPFLLRKNPFAEDGWNGLTFSSYAAQSRTADNGSETEDQVITPDYVVDDIIYACANVRGGTDTSVGEDESAKEVVWVDMNFDGRCWAKVFEE